MMDWNAITVALIVALIPTVPAVLTLVISLRASDKVEEVHKATNSMKDALVAAALVEGHEKGVQQEKRAEAARQEKTRKVKG